ncbi:MAG: hypothetical protein M1840_001385 [Geoglossum simile]|nr:MAG: hypothetical protein M1840_001385 [Geoglossum simile]
MRHKSKKHSARAAENDYGSDGGFVVDSDGEGDIPLAKRMKTTVVGGKEGGKSRQKKKPAKGEAVGSADIDDNGDMFWEISHSRRVTISEFKGRRMVSVREYYEKDGKHLPGKKGISMPIDQYSKFLAIIPEIETALEAKGEEVVRPVFNNSSSGRSRGDVDSDDSTTGEEGESGDEREKKGIANTKIRNGDGNRKKNGVKKDVRKKNFEATSDEEEVVAERAHEGGTNEE